MKRMVLIPEERLLQYERQQRDPVSNITEHSQYEEKEHDVQNGSGEERELTDDVIVRGIPKTMRTRALALLERLRARADVISWDDMGQVKIDGVLIPKSNISDLVSSAMRSRKHFDPVASREFFGVLSKLNVPKDLVRNEEGWKGVVQKGKGDLHLISPGAWYQTEKAQWTGIGQGKRKKPEEGPTQKGKGELSDDFSEAWYHLERTPRKRVFRKGRGKRKGSQKGGFAFGPYTQGITGIERKRRHPQKGSRRIPNWECYKG